MDIYILLLAIVLLPVIFVIYTRLSYPDRVKRGKWVFNIISSLNNWFCQSYHNFHNILDLPSSGGAVLVCNHQSGLDGLLLYAAANRKLSFLMDIDYYKLPFVHALAKMLNFIPVDRVKKNTNALEQAVAALKSGKIIAVFPYGGFHLTGEPDPPAIKTGAVIMAELAKVPLYSVRLDNISGAGFILKGLFKRGKPTLKLQSINYCTGNNRQEILSKLAEELSNNN